MTKDSISRYCLFKIYELAISNSPPTTSDQRSNLYNDVIYQNCHCQKTVSLVKSCFSDEKIQYLEIGSKNLKMRYCLLSSDVRAPQCIICIISFVFSLLSRESRRRIDIMYAREKKDRRGRQFFIFIRQSVITSKRTIANHR